MPNSRPDLTSTIGQFYEHQLSIQCQSAWQLQLSPKQGYIQSTTTGNILTTLARIGDGATLVKVMTMNMAGCLS